MTLSSPARYRAHWAASLVLLAFTVTSAGAETRVGGTLKGETRWTRAGSPYIVTEDVTIPKGSQLSIEPGVTVRFKKNINDQHGTNFFDLEIIVEGRLVAHGAEGDTIRFTSDDSRPTWLDWHGIVIQGPEASADLRAVHIEYCNVGLTVHGASLAAQDVTLRYSHQYGVLFAQGRGTLQNILATEIGNQGGTGIGVWADRKSDVSIVGSFLVGVQNGVSFTRGSTGRIKDTVITLCASNGVVIRNSSPEITGCTITGNENGLVLSAGARPAVHGNNLFDNGASDVQLREYRGELFKFDLSNNWWGTDNPTLIEERVLDGLDDPTEKVLAVVEPFLTEAVTREPGAKP